MILTIIIAFLALLLLWILLAPVMVSVDTERGLYRVMLPGLFAARVLPAGQLFRIRAWILFIPFSLNPWKMGKKRAKKEISAPGKRKNKKRKSGSIRMFRKLSGAIWIRNLELDLDTDDYLLNAWLVPAFAALNQNGNMHMQVNFEGNLRLKADVRTQVGKLLWIMMMGWARR